MSSNLNNLVQPECGGSNPLVLAAQQITSVPGTTSRLGAQSQIDFAREFMQQQGTKILSNNLTRDEIYVQTNSRGTRVGLDVYQNNTSFPNSSFSRPLMMSGYESHRPIAVETAGDQLEAKYREDMISQPENKVDDLAFWQNLSQKYIGPNTYGVLAETNHIFERPQPDLEYTFEERNPLKDQYEDPFAEGLKKLEQGDIPSAVLLFEAAVQLKPDDAMAWRYLGTTQAQNENDHSAIRALRNCLNLNQDDQLARLAISVSLANETEHHEACKHLLEWLMRHERYRTIGASLEEFRRFDSELSDDPFYLNAVDQKHYTYVRDKFVEAARMSPNNPDPEVQNSLGVLFNIRGEYEKAVDCFKAALSVRSDDSVLWNRLGATLANGNKPDEAVIAYRKALEISPGFLRSRYNLAISLVHMNIYDEAGKQLVQILNMQAAGQGSKNTQIRTRSITSSTIWNTLRTVATLLNKPELYPIIDGRDLDRCTYYWMHHIKS